MDFVGEPQHVKGAYNFKNLIEKLSDPILLTQNKFYRTNYLWEIMDNKIYKV